MGLKEDALNLHGYWKGFKSGMGAEMIKQTKVKFTGGLGPALDTLSKKWGTNDGQKAAEKVKKVVTDYRKLLAGIKAGEGKYAVPGQRGQAWEAQKKKAEELFKDMMEVATKHKVPLPPKK